MQSASITMATMIYGCWWCTARWLKSNAFLSSFFFSSSLHIIDKTRNCTTHHPLPGFPAPHPHPVVAAQDVAKLWIYYTSPLLRLSVTAGLHWVWTEAPPSFFQHPQSKKVGYGPVNAMPLRPECK